jgi:hypothetical protein
MVEKINLEVPATLTGLSTVRIVLGGLGAGLDFSLEEVDDLSIATDALFHAALQSEPGERFSADVVIADGSLTVHCGAFSSSGLRGQVESGSEGCLDLCRLLHETVDEFRCCDTGDSYQVVLVKRGHGGTATV